jgi:hypothetical protein
MIVPWLDARNVYEFVNVPIDAYDDSDHDAFVPMPVAVPLIST